MVVALISYKLINLVCTGKGNGTQKKTAYFRVKTTKSQEFNHNFKKTPEVLQGLLNRISGTL